MAALTFDTGALIALSRGDKRMRAVLVAAQERRAVITVPAVVVAEWWRVDSRRSRLILERVDVEPVSERLAKDRRRSHRSRSGSHRHRRDRHGIGRAAW
ncbi:MAG: hypothetical protein AB1689_22135 [Thermodesulfobacteriota bacterium]